MKLFLFFILLSGLCLAEPDALSEALKRVRPQADADTVLKFYKDNAPDLLEEVARRRQDYPAAMDNYLQHLVDHFLEIDKIREMDKVSYERLVKQERLQCQVRMLSREIQQLAKKEQDAKAENEAARMQKLNEAKQKLRKLLEDIFDESQRQQLIEINRLEAEVMDLRRLATEREANRAFILQQRFKTLTGMEWPE